MNEFLHFYNRIKLDYPWSLEIYYSSIMDWHISVEYKTPHVTSYIISVQDSDMELVFAKAQVELKKYMLEHYGGY